MAPIQEHGSDTLGHELTIAVNYLMNEEAKRTPGWLIACRHLVGTMVVSLAWTEVYTDISPLKSWFVPWLGSLMIATAIFGLFALFFTRQAKKYWPTGFYTTWWVLVLLVVGGSWLQVFNEKERARESRFNGAEQSIEHPKSSAQERWWEGSQQIAAPPSDKKAAPEDLFEKFGIDPKQK